MSRTVYSTLLDEIKTNERTAGLDQARLVEHTRWPQGRTHALKDDDALPDEARDAITVTEEELDAVREHDPELADLLDRYTEQLERFSDLGEQLEAGLKTGADTIERILPEHMYNERMPLYLVSELENESDTVVVEDKDRKMYPHSLRVALPDWAAANSEAVLEADNARNFSRLLVGNADEAKDALAIRGTRLSSLYKKWSSHERDSLAYKIDEEGRWYDNLWELVTDAEIIDGRTVRDVLQERQKISNEVAEYARELEERLETGINEGLDEDLYSSEEEDSYEETGTQTPM